MYTKVHRRFIHNRQKLETTQMSSKGQMVKWWTVVNPHHECGHAHSCLSLQPPWTVARQAPLSTGSPRQEYWSGLSFPSPGDLSDPGIEPVSPVSPALAGGFFIHSNQKAETITCGHTPTLGIMLSDKRQFQKVTSCKIPFISYSWNNEITELEKRSVAARSRRGWRVAVARTDNMRKTYCDGNVLHLPFLTIGFSAVLLL